MPERAGWVRLNAGDAGWVQRRSAFVHFELRGLSPGSSTKAAEFLGSETLRLARDPGRLPGDDLRTPGRAGEHRLWAARAGALHGRGELPGRSLGANEETGGRGAAPGWGANSVALRAPSVSAPTARA